MEDVIEVVVPALAVRDVDFFRKATLSTHSRNIPLTFPTTFRKPEFEWLDRLKVDMRNLLHTEQQYEYLIPLQLGDVPAIRTRIKDHKERKTRRLNLTIVVLESEVRCAGILKLRSTTTFVLREDVGEPS